MHRRLRAIGAGLQGAAAFAATASRGWAEWAEPVGAEVAARLTLDGRTAVAVGRDRTLLAGDHVAMASAARALNPGLADWLAGLDPCADPSGAPAPLVCGPHRLHFGHKTYIVGIVNRTPDSFSDGTGTVPPAEQVVAAAWSAYRSGADIVDLGAESTEEREHGGLDPGREAERLLPVLAALRDLPALISIDCRHASVARQALALHPVVLNDVDALAEPEFRGAAAESAAPVVLMHAGEIPPGLDPWAVVAVRLRVAVARAVAAGVPREQIILDAGFGFGTTPEQDLEVTSHLGALKALGRPLMHAPSRKRTIGRILAFPETIAERVHGTGALVAIGIASGADLVRVHDLPAMAWVARVADACARGPSWHDIVAP